MNEQEQHNIEAMPPSNEAQIIVEKSKAKLPKIELGRGERFYLNGEELAELNEKYFGILSNMNEAVGVPAELRSVMESGLYLAYMEEVSDRRLNNALERSTERMRVEMLNAILTPQTWRNWWWLFKKHRNSAQILLDELVSRQTVEYLGKKQNELPSTDRKDNADIAPFNVTLEAMRELLPKMRKSKRNALEKVIAGLAASYEEKAEEQKRNAAELEEVKKMLEQARERVDELEALTAELIESSEELPIEEAEEETQVEAETAEQTEEANGEEEETAETADEDEDYGLSYDGLDENDGQE